MTPARRREEFDRAEMIPVDALPADLQRSIGREATLRVVQAAAARTRPAEHWRDSYFQRGGYANLDPEDWAKKSPDAETRLDMWVETELRRSGLPNSLCALVVRMALITMKYGVDAARRVLLEETTVPEQYHFAIDGILKSIPPLV